MPLISFVIMAVAASAPIDDSTLSCPQIAALTTELEVQAEKEDADAVSRAGQARFAKGLLGALASSALGAAPAALAGPGDGWGGFAAQQALSAASAASAQALQDSAAAPAEHTPRKSPTRARLERLADLAASQGC